VEVNFGSWYWESLGVPGRSKKGEGLEKKGKEMLGKEVSTGFEEKRGGKGEKAKEEIFPKKT